MTEKYEFKTSDLETDANAFCLKTIPDGKLLFESIGRTERTVKQFVLLAWGVISPCTDEGCDCVHKAFDDVVDQTKCVVVAVSIKEVVK